MGLRVLIVARTDAEQADWIQSDLDGRDQEFIMGATNPIANFETNKREDLARTERNLQESMHHQQHLMSMGINVGEDEQITPATIKKSLNAFAKDWDDNYKPKWDAMFKLMVVDGNMRRYNDVIIEGQNNSLNGEGLQELHNFWKKIARIRTIDQVVEETIRNSKTSLPITPEEWRNWVNGLERSRNFDFFGAVEKKALELGIEIYNSQSWKKAVRDNRTMNINGNHIFWDQNTASFLDTTGHLWMIDSSINMAIARNKYSLAQADIQWFEQHKPDWLEVAHWAVELDKEAIELLKRKNFWGILDQYQPTQQERFKPGIVQILGKYLLGTRYTDKNGFLGALRSLMVLGITEKDSRMLLQSVVRIKANNTSPSFYWRGAKKENGETFTDEDLRTFLIKQAPFSQFNFSTYFGSVQAHADAIEFANRFLEDGTLHYAKRQVAGAQVGSGMATNPQQFAGTASGADADAAGKGSIGLGADSSKSTMRARTKAIEKIVDFKRAHELTLTLFAKANFKQVLNQVAGRDLLPEEQSAAFHYITDLIVRSSGLPLTDPISDTKYQKGMVFKNEIITENDINQMSNTGQKILAHVILRLLNSLEKIKDVNLTPVNPRTGEPEKKVDHAMKTPGGINLDPALLDLQIKRDGKGIPLPLSQQTLGNMKIDGFLPVIITIQPMTDLKKLLGFAEVPLQRQQIAKA